MIDTLSDAQDLNSRIQKPQSQGSRLTRTQAVYGMYALALAVAISVWFIPIRAPLWLDETASYWQISAGLPSIWPRQIVELCFPAYTFILWCWTKIAGTGVLALRLPSILAMSGAVYLLYLAARELFDRDVAFVAAIIFCLHPLIIFASIDARPYAFGVLATNAAILVLLRMRRSRSNWLAALFGFTAAFSVYFHYLFAAILPAFVLCFFVFRKDERKISWRQFGIAVAILALASLPMLPGLHYLFSTSRTHVWESTPKFSELLWTLAPGFVPFTFVGTALGVLLVIAASGRKADALDRIGISRILICASLAFIPLFILYGVSTATSIRVFAAHHRPVAVPGIALCWGLLVSLFPSRGFRLLFCLALVGITASAYFLSPVGGQHGFTWKYALDVAEKNASDDNAPVLICSDFVESNYSPIPLDSAKNSLFFPQLSYYKLSAPVVPLPETLNEESVRVASQFLRIAARDHQRFLALADIRVSASTLQWLLRHAPATYNVHNLGTFGRIEVLEFVPRGQAAHSSRPRPSVDSIPQGGI